MTSNDLKFGGVQSVIPDLQRVCVDVPTAQGLSPNELIKAKLQGALDYDERPLIVMETFLFLDGLHGLPGPMTKDFMENLGNSGLIELVEKYQNNDARVKTIIGYASKDNEMQFFESEAKGKIVKPYSPALDLEDWQELFVPNEENESTVLQSAKKLKVFLNSTESIISSVLEIGSSNFCHENLTHYSSTH